MSESHPKPDLYEKPLVVDSVDECNFYHTADIPGTGLVQGQWDLRGGVDQYLGGYDFTDKRVLEIGPATGFLTFEIEKKASDIVAVELPLDRNFWNAVPYESLGLGRNRSQQWTEAEEQFHEHISRIRNGFWFSHRQHGSKTRVYHGSSEELPSELGDFDVVLLASVLLHTRSPVSVLESCARRVTGSMIITELYDPDLGEGPVCSLVPTADNKAWDTWWKFSPRFFTQYLEVLGFEQHELSFHDQLADDKPVSMYTIVSSRPGVDWPVEK